MRYITNCCEAKIEFRGLAEGLFCSKCKKEIWHYTLVPSFKEWFLEKIGVTIGYEKKWK